MPTHARVPIFVAWMLFTAVAASCSSSSGTDDGEPAAEAGAPVAATTVGAMGGVVASSDHRVQVTIPAGALATSTTITITPSASSVPGAIGTVWEIGPTGTQFATPVTITLAYADADLGGQPTSHFAVSTITNGAWAPIAASLIDPNGHVMSGQTTHLSPYAIAALPSQTTTTDAATDAGEITDADSPDSANPARDSGADADSGACARCAVELANGQDVPHTIAVDGQYVYWTNFGRQFGVGTNYYNGSVMRVPIAGGPPTMIASQLGSPEGVVVDATKAYFFASAPNPDGGLPLDYHQILSVPLAGGVAPTVLTSFSGLYHSPDSTSLDRSGDLVGGLFLYNSTLYWTTWNGYVDSMPVTGATPTALTLNANFYNPGARDIVVDSTGVYVACSSSSSLCSPDAGGNVYGLRVPLVSGGPVTTLPHLFGGYGVALTSDATYLYYTAGGQVVRAAKDVAGSIDLLAAAPSGEQQPYSPGIAVDEKYVYWTNFDGEIKRVEKDGSGTAVSIASKQYNAYGIAVDANNVYWTTAIGHTANSGGTVMKLPK